jgi:hypothetical protein
MWRVLKGVVRRLCRDFEIYFSRNPSKIKNLTLATPKGHAKLKYEQPTPSTSHHNHKQSVNENN